MRKAGIELMGAANFALYLSGERISQETQDSIDQKSVEFIYANQFSNSFDYFDSFASIPRMPYSLLLAKDWDYVKAVGSLKTGNYFDIALGDVEGTLTPNQRKAVIEFASLFMGSSYLAEAWLFNNRELTEPLQVIVDAAVASFIQAYPSLDQAAFIELTILATDDRMPLTSLTELEHESLFRTLSVITAGKWPPTD